MDYTDYLNRLDSLGKEDDEYFESLEPCKCDFCNAKIGARDWAIPSGKFLPNFNGIYIRNDEDFIYCAKCKESGEYIEKIKEITGYDNSYMMTILSYEVQLDREVYKEGN